MDSNIILRIHGISVMLFLLTYVIKTILIFTNKAKLDRYSAITKVPEMIISFAFLVSGIWLYVIIGGIKYVHIIKLVLVFLSIPVAIIGFKKHKKGLALLSLIMIIGAYGIAEMSRSKPFIPANTTITVTATDPLFSEGALIYHQNCAFCHGNDGNKAYRNAPDLTGSMFQEDAIKQMVIEGSKGKMPAYKFVLTGDQVTAVSKYVASLKPLKQ